MVDTNLLTSIVNGLTESEAIDLVLVLRKQFDWQVTLFTTEDIEMRTSDWLGRDATEEEVEKVRATYEWNHIEDGMCQHGNESIDWALVDLFGGSVDKEAGDE